MTGGRLALETPSVGDLDAAVVFWMAVAYLVSAIPIGLILGKFKGIDIREHGSGNIGATNAGRVLGAKWGVAVLILDVAKAALPVYLATRSVDGPTGRALVGLMAMLGHVFPVYLGFRGGKGVACALGVFAVLAPASAIVAIALYAQTVILTRVSAVGSLTAGTGMVAYLCLTDQPPAFRLLAIAAWVLIWVRHRDNLSQIAREARARKRATRPDQV